MSWALGEVGGAEMVDQGDICGESISEASEWQ
jgi:hypothetical protein